MQQPPDMLSVLTALPLFAGCPPDVLAKVLLPDCRMATYEAGESIRQYDDPPVLCILTAGSASVHTSGESSECLLRVLHADDVFGVATLFAASPAVTRVTAEQPTRVLIVSEAAVRALLTGTPASRSTMSPFSPTASGFSTGGWRVLARVLPRDG